MKIVMLDRNSLGMDMDVSIYEKLGDFEAHPVAGREECKNWIKDADVVIFNKTVMDEDMLKDAPKVKLLCVTATGYDNIDLNYARSRQIAVSNVRDYSTPAVAQHTFAMALYVLEKISYYDEYVKSGAYSNQLGFSNFDERFWELEGKTWGIIGMGNIGRNVARIAEAFGCRVIFYSASGKNTSTDYERVELDTLLAQSDVLSIHCPLSDRTRNLINKDTLRQMKPSAILVNVARGPVVNDGDLCEALEQGIIAGAGLDVLGKEPMEKTNPLGRIKDSRRLLITPHMAWASVESRTRCLDEVYQNIEAFAKGEQRNRVDI
ncbi:MAG: D-2-hydroxyacid dehydrogenase [Lachnospiraceae bacterium]|nr:D-2-hydroxyacid dehydrogenase [Lachnospiraceae bacterium]